jgi:hypothetical protein
VIPEELLRLAGILASADSGRPAWVSRNRAVSTAYYALFHALAAFCARELVGAWRPWLPFRHVYRSLEHGPARRILDIARRDKACDAETKIVADTFIELQELRHGADYDPGFRISKRELETLLSQVGDAIQRLEQLPERKLLAARLIGRTR